jgi:hypothetical protein
MKLFFCVLALVGCQQLFAQPKPTELDKSPMDVSYCPTNYPVLKMNGKLRTAPVARVLYSRPQKNGREIFGGIVQEGELWRLGANEATEIEFYKPVRVGNKTLPKGKYSLYAVPQANSWTIIFNSETDVWGLAHNDKRDLVKISAAVTEETETVENFTIYFDLPASNKMVLNILWDTKKASFPITVL